MNLEHDFVVLAAILAAGLHVLGIFSAIQAIAKARTSQGAIAWAISLVSFPYISLPLFWIFGRDRFLGYTVERKAQDMKVGHLRRQDFTAPTEAGAPDIEPAVRGVFENLAKMRFSRGNEATLCIDGEATFEAIFAAIARAERYLLVQFFIVHDDEIGRAFKAKLTEAARRGLRIYFLYDEIGSHALPRRYIDELKAEGIQVRPFRTTKGAKNRFQINFRNHRKIVVADGRVALLGGLNVGDEYLGRSKKFGPWRDTYVRIEGPAVRQVQVSFIEDWHWSSGTVPELFWEPPAAAAPGKAALVIPSGPADGLDTCCLFFLQAINFAKRRIWITSPYFVPDPQILSALQLAAMRGVDVRIILPCMPDHLWVYLASFSFLKDTLPHGVRLYRYQEGFIHEKVLLIDDDLAGVGTANFDNRSFRLNFEITALIADKAFCGEVEKMLEADFARSKLVSMDELRKRSLFFRVAVMVARLMAPIL